jgi:hypothetical protein
MPKFNKYVSTVTREVEDGILSERLKTLSPLQPLTKKGDFSKYYLCEISSSHGGEYDIQNCLLGCTAM